MKLDEVSKEIIKTFDFDEILNPDLTDEEKVSYYEGLLAEAESKKDVQSEDKIITILNDLLNEGESDE